jgi:photosystem II cytochrome c550
MKQITSHLYFRLFGGIKPSQNSPDSDWFKVAKRAVLLLVSVAFFSFQLSTTQAIATELDVGTRTLPLNAEEQPIVLTLDQIQQGKRLFDSTCSQCHASGTTKTNPIVGLDPEALAKATPRRDTVEGMVDYMHNPTTYDGEKSIAELHPSTASSDVFPEMRNLTDDELRSIAGYILLQPKVIGQKWGGGKIYY